MNVLETEPATPSQVGVVVGQFERLGFTRHDRAERLAISAAFLGLDGLESTKDLTKGQAGKLYSLLLGIGDRDELRAAAGLDVKDLAVVEPSSQTLAGVIFRIAVLARSISFPLASMTWTAPGS